MITDLELMRQASEATGLADFGPDDDFRAGLRILLADLEASSLGPAERQALLANWRGRLELRLQLQSLRNLNPDIAKQDIEGPLVVCGLPRTGTTSLIDLLAQDPASRVLYTWESLNIYPPARRAHWLEDPRIAECEAQLGGLVDKRVEKAGLHFYGAMLPGECSRLLQLSFWGTRYPGEPEALHLLGSSEWMNTCTPTRPFAMHRRILQSLQAHGPAGRWTLKEPHHVFALGELLAEYPDAMIVQTHRDPFKVFPSLFGLYATVRGQSPDDPARKQTARYLLTRWEAGLRRGMAARKDPAVNERIVDVSNRQIIADPMGTVRMIYDRFNLPLTQQAEAHMAEWLKNPAQHESALHFTLEEFDLTPADIENSIGPYMEQFGTYF